MSVLLAGWALQRCFRVYEWWRTVVSQAGPAALSDGLPLPPPTLRVQVAGTANIESFLHGGQLAAQTVRELLAASGKPLDSCTTILDFGCACGRVLRQWKDLEGTAVYGTDVNPNLVRWSQENLAFASVSVNPPDPPLSFADEYFDALYAFSVFTHMPAQAQKGWLNEFRRILKPGGLLIFSTHGDYYLPRLHGRERTRFREGQLVVRFASAAGSNLCCTYHPEAFVRRELAPGWDVVIFAAEGARGNPRQDVWVFRRT